MIEKLVFGIFPENMIFKEKMQFPMENMALLSFELTKFFLFIKIQQNNKLFNLVDQDTLDKFQSFVVHRP